MSKPGIKHVEVQIMGQNYLLACPEDGEADLLAAVDKVDHAMCRIRDAGKVKARDRIAVLASLNIAFELSAAHAQTAHHQPPPSRRDESFHLEIPHSTGDMDAQSLVRLKSLIDRMDQVLGQDGQLI